jgi:DNA mismatch endonuclease (patch repair protein)
MTDRLTKAKRSALMARIRPSGNRSTELRVATIMRKARISGWRRHATVRVAMPSALNTAVRASVVVRPDFVFWIHRVAIFVDGCFWHGCPKHYSRPTNNELFWKKKVRANKDRDRRVTRVMRLGGWSVVRLWEHDLESPGHVLRQIRKGLTRARPKRNQVASRGQR